MKARRKGTNDNWQDIATVRLKDSYLYIPSHQIEFKGDTLSPEPKTFNQLLDENHWQDVRERAAIAAMQGILANPDLVDDGINYKIEVEKYAIGYADALVEQLKKK